jgi:hypothetical protein
MEDIMTRLESSSCFNSSKTENGNAGLLWERGLEEIAEDSACIPHDEAICHSIHFIWKRRRLCAGWSAVSCFPFLGHEQDQEEKHGQQEEGQ